MTTLATSTEKTAQSNSAPKNGRITVIAGPMHSGKTTELLRRVRRALLARKKTQVFKSVLDDRYQGIRHVCSHDGLHIEAQPIAVAMEILEHIEKDTEIVAIDEAQFLDDEIVVVVDRLAAEGRMVILSGLDLDYRGQPFGAMPLLLAIADEVVKLDAICARCGQSATRTQRLVNGVPAPADGPTVLVGASEHYESRCRSCHEVA